MFWKKNKKLTLQKLIKRKNNIELFQKITIMFINLSKIIIPCLLFFLLKNIYLDFKISSMYKEIMYEYLFNEKVEKINSLILKKYLILKFEKYLIKFKNKELMRLKNELSQKEPVFNVINKMNDLKNYIKNKNINIKNLLNSLHEIENKLNFNTEDFLNDLNININEIEKIDFTKENNEKLIQFELLRDNTVISNKINELIKSYKLIEKNTDKLDINEKIELNKVLNAIKKIIFTFNKVKDFNNDKVDNNLKLLITDLKLLIHSLNQSIQNKVIKDMKILSKTLKLEI